MDHRGQAASHPPQNLCPPRTRRGKKNAAPLLSALGDLCDEAGRGCDPRTAARTAQHVLGQLACLGAHTVTGVVGACGRPLADWTADYRLYGRGRAQPERLFEPVRRWLCASQQGPVVTAMDDTCLRKTGRKVHGAKYLRDPMGPPFRVNLIRAQRFVQTAMACRAPGGAARMVPVDWVHAPMPAAPGPRADEEARREHRALQRRCRVSAVGAQRIAHLRGWLDSNGQRGRPLWSLVDGSYTNGTVLRALPENTVLVGRIRADAKLHFPPQGQPEKGRRRVYGEKAPTPEQLRQDPAVPWETLRVFFGGKKRAVRVKRITPLRWRTAGEGHSLQLIVVAPTAYRLSPRGKQLYRNPAYLICTDPNADPGMVVQHYFWRWDIEVCHRDEKTLLGVGDAQVRTPNAVQNVTGCAVAAYAMLLAAEDRCRKERRNCEHLPRPKWQKRKPKRATTMSLIKNLRYELWGPDLHFSGFARTPQKNTKPEKCLPPLHSALFYASTYS